MGALNTYRDHVVHLTEGMEDFDGFVPPVRRGRGQKIPNLESFE